MQFKKKLILIFLGLVLFSFSIVGAPAAQDQDITVIIDEQDQSFSPSPIINNDRTLVPMRPFFEALGAEVDWDNESKTVVGIRDAVVVELTINQTAAFVNDRQVNLATPGQIIDGSTYVPLRFVGEALGDDVVWDGTKKTISITSTSGHAQNHPVLKVHFIDVGQGDSELVQFPNGKTMLIDGGKGGMYARVAAVLAAEKIKKLDVVIGTHTDDDHIGSLPGIIKNYEVGTVYLNGTDETRVYDALIREAHSKGLVVNQLLQGDTLNLDPEVEIKVLAPSVINTDRDNDNSPIMKVTYRNKSFLFTGDAEKATENVALAYDQEGLKSDVVKVGHHGSTTSSTPAFAKAVSPALAIIEVGADNSYGHPDEIVVNRWQLLGAKVYTTAVHGNLTVTTDGNNLGIFSDKNNEALEKALNAKNSATEKDIEANFIGNKNTKVFHYSNCTSVGTMNEKNKVLLQSTHDALDAGYSSCGICRP
ncbi:MAG: stalk domain-containing protein [Dehalobacterium sp.]|jgi:competence protein ComEC